MIRWQLPVWSPVSLAGLAAAGRAAVTGRVSSDDLTRTLRTHYGASRVVLTDSGTSALVMALRLLVPRDGVVALPAYGCIDLTAAAVFAGVRVRLYDVDPATLSVDLDSLEATLGRGVNAVVIAHLYGFPSDVREASRIAARHGVPVIEDAAQAAGGTLCGSPLGALGASLAVLSFGRGKGTTSGGGGALLSFTPELAAPLVDAHDQLVPPSRGWRETIASAAQWMLGRPRMYGIPASIPALRLGEMVYHPAHEPGAMAIAARALLRNALEVDGRERRLRRMNANKLASICDYVPDIRVPNPLPGAEPGYLRFPVLDRTGARTPLARSGILRGYPMTLAEHAELRNSLCPGEPPMRGAEVLRDTLFTLPTHSRVRANDVAAITRWLSTPLPRAVAVLHPPSVA